MPTRSFFHKNRSTASLLSTQQESSERRSVRSYQASPIDSPLHSPRFPSSSAASPEGRDNDDDDDDDNNEFGQPSVYRPDEARSYYASNLTRSQSQRTPPVNPAEHQPKINLVNSAATSANQNIDSNPDSYYLQALPTAPPKEDSRRKRFFNKLGSSASTPKEQRYNTPPTATRLGRSTSVKRKDSQVPTDTENYRHTLQPQWPAHSGFANPHQQPTNLREEEEGEPTPRRVEAPQDEVGPPIPEKDPLRSPPYSPNSSQEAPSARAPLQGVATNIPQRHPYERQNSATSSARETSTRSLVENSRETPQRNTVYQQSPSSVLSSQPPPSYHSSPASATSTSSHQLPIRGLQDIRQQYRQDQQRDRPPSQQSYEPPSPLQASNRGFDPHHERQGSARSSLSAYTTTNSMGPPTQPPQQAQGRNSTELVQQQPGSAREGSGYQPYNQGPQGQNPPPNQSNQYDSRLGVNQQGQQYRGTPQPSPLPAQAASEQGRSTPPPSRSRDDLSNLDVNQLVSRHDELHVEEKYRKVKKYYFDKDAQVQQLQNTLAHLRLLQSRTSLDDNEYTNRFSRLDGAINNLAFNLRRDWRSVPPWLGQYVNKDAATSPTKEMTAVGRACISRWLVDELFERFFHPGLEPVFSAQLKIIEKNLRRLAAPTPTEEEKEALIARISNWRLATVDGLQEPLNSPSAMENREQLTEALVEKLVASLSMLLKDSALPGLEGGVSMIIELAIGISANLPLESRDVYINYVLPGARIDDGYMKVESGLPPLTNPGEGIPEEGQGDDSGSLTGAEQKDINEMDDRASNNGPLVQQERKEMAREREAPPQAAKKKGMFGGLMGGNKKGGPSTGAAGNGAAQQQLQQPPPPKEERVRFSAFMAVENRGRSVLVKAPVYTIEVPR